MEESHLYSGDIYLNFSDLPDYHKNLVSFRAHADLRHMAAGAALCWPALQLSAKKPRTGASAHGRGGAGVKRTETAGRVTRSGGAGARQGGFK